MPEPQRRDARYWDRQVEKFLRLDTGFLDGSPDLCWQPLREFLGRIRDSNPYAAITHFPVNDCRILYDSILREGDRGAKTDSPRAKGHGTSTDFSHCSDSRERRVMDDKQLFQHTHSPEARRTTYYITDMSPFCAATIGTRENPDWVHVLREYFHCHLSGETYLISLKPGAHNASPHNEWPRHVATARKFTYEFHFSYVVLRDRGVGPDPRKIRKWYPLIKAFDPDMDTYEKRAYNLACYDAHVSFLIVGTDENNWKAYCNSDTWYGDNMPIEKYISDNLDAPAGDARTATNPCMDPREYFLLVLAHRMRQLSHEWGNVSCALISRLSAYEAYYLGSIDNLKADLHDDKNMSRTRAYLKAASMLRQFHDTLSSTLDSYHAFISENKDLFKNQDNFEDRCECYENIIRYQVAHLTRIKKRFSERMLRFESMRDSMMTASLLRENRQATQQSQDIELLTKVTVLYLPFTFAATVCGISGTLPPWKVIGFGVSVAMLAATPTILYAFRLWRGRSQPPEHDGHDGARRKSSPLLLH